MKIKKIALLMLPLLMLASCGGSKDSSGDTSSYNSSETSEVAKTYSITASSGDGYTITDLSATTAKRGDKITFKVTVTDSTKLISKVKYNTTELTADDSGVYSFTMPARAVTISVELRDKPTEYTITATNGDGYTITDLSATSAIAGAAITFKVNLTASDKAIQSVKANDISCVKSGDLYTFDMPASAVTITVTLSSAHTITATDGDGYTISDLSDSMTYAGKTVSFKVTVTDAMKEIDTVKANNVDCTSVGAGTYSFVMPDEAVTINVTLKGASLGLDLTNAQTGYIINLLVPSQSDVFTSEGIKLYTTDSTGASVELTEEQYATVVYSSPDIEDLSQPIESTGVKTIVVTFGEYSRSFQIAVGTYEVNEATLVQSDLNVKLAVNCTYTGLSQAQFLAFDWGMDLQHNDNVDGQGWGIVIDTDNEGTDLSFAFGENNTVSFSLDISSLENGAYTTHFGHKEVDNGNNSKQKMDLLDPDGEAKRIVVGEKAYMIQFGAFWSKGEVDITVANASDAYDKVEREITGTTLEKTSDNKAMVTISGKYDSYYNETLTDDDISFYCDFEQLNTWTTVTYDEANNINTLEAIYTIDKTTQTYSITFDIYDILKEGGEDNAWFMHINNSSTNFSYADLVGTTITMDDGSTIRMDTGSNLGTGSSWTNSLVCFSYTAPAPEKDENISVDSLRYVYDSTTKAINLEVSGNYNYATGTPTIQLGDDATHTATATVSDNTFTASLDVSWMANQTDVALAVNYNNGTEDKTINVTLDDLASAPKLGATEDALYGYRTNSKGIISLRKNTADTFEVGKVELSATGDNVSLHVMGAIRQGTDMTNPTFSLSNTTFSAALEASAVDSNGYVDFTVDVTNAPEFSDPGQGNSDYMFLINAGATTTSYEFWPGDWAYQIDVESVTTSAYTYRVGRVSQSWGSAQYRLEKTALSTTAE